MFTIIIFSPGLPNMGAQIRYVQNWYTALQTDPKYPLILQKVFADLFCFCIEMSNQNIFQDLIKILKIYNLKKLNNFVSLYKIYWRFLKILDVSLLRLPN